MGHTRKNEKRKRIIFGSVQTSEEALHVSLDNF